VQVVQWRDGIFLWASKCALRCDTELPYALMCDRCAAGHGFFSVAEVKHAQINLGFGLNCQFRERLVVSWFCPSARLGCEALSIPARSRHHGGIGIKNG
jgi:hypothetical protein